MPGPASLSGGSALDCVVVMAILLERVGEMEATKMEDSQRDLALRVESSDI